MEHQTETGDSTGSPTATDTGEAAAADVTMITKEYSTAG